jgi:hypothetical protein
MFGIFVESSRGRLRLLLQETEREEYSLEDDESIFEEDSLEFPLELVVVSNVSLNLLADVSSDLRIDSSSSFLD